MISIPKTISKTKSYEKDFYYSALLPALLFILPGYVFSQTKMKLSGTVSDSSKPLALVTVRIFKKINQPPLQTTLSKENGSFQFNKPDTGNYILSFTHTGFAEKQINITVAPAGRRYADRTSTTIQSNRHAERSNGKSTKANGGTIG